jgi:very-short-patch-repair endonuclease
MDMLHGSVSRSEILRRTGSDAALMREVRAGRMRREHRGVYVDVRHDFDLHARWAAALLRAGADAHLSFATAGGSHGLHLEDWTDDPSIHISIPHFRRPRPIPGVVLHRPARLPMADRAIRDGLPVTGFDRTVLDLCGTFESERARIAFVAEVLQNGRTTMSRLQACAARSGGIRGVAGLLRALTELGPGYETVSELDLARICVRAGLQVEPQRTVVVTGGKAYRLDLLDEELLIGVESDGRGHLSLAVREEDVRRDEALRRTGLAVARFTRRQIRREPRYVFRELAQLREERASQYPRPRLTAGARLLP